MSGILANAIFGAVAGAGQGMAENAKQGWLQDNLKLKSQLDTERETFLEQLKAASSKEVAGIHAKSAIDVANIHGDTSRDVADTHAESARDVADIGSDRALDVARVHAGATVQAANIHAAASRELAKNRLQVGEDGVLYKLNDDEDGTSAEPVTGPDGNPLKVQKNLNAETAAKITTLTKLIEREEAGLKSIYDPAEKTKANARIGALYQQLSSAAGIDSPMGRAAAGAGAKTAAPKPWEYDWSKGKAY
jgi:hypothetical protein